jgi:dUTP pyrophosphatase
LLSGQQIVAEGIVAEPAAEAVQPNGVDLTLEALWQVQGAGSLGMSNAERVLPERSPLEFDLEGWAHLPQGVYGLRFGEVVNFPLDCGGLAFPRSSLMRMGAWVPTAVWDAGYRGKAESLLQVTNPAGLRLQKGARVVQLVVWRLNQAAQQGYQGAYLNENLS